MSIKKLPITSREQWLAMRKEDLTASVAGAIVTDHPYMSFYQLWSLKSGLTQEDPEDSPAMKRGRLLEPVAIELLREMRPTWTVERALHYYRDPAIRLGATPDVLAIDPERGPGVVQIKSVQPRVFRKVWKQEDGSVSPPDWITIQAIVEAHLTGAKWAAVAALVADYGLDLHVVEVPVHAALIKAVRTRTVEFWNQVYDGPEPDPHAVRDFDAIQAAALAAGEGPHIDLSHDNLVMDLLDERARLSADKSDSEKRLKEIKGELLIKLAGAGSASAADGRIITSKTVKRNGYTVEPTEYRDVRVKAAPKGRA